MPQITPLESLEKLAVQNLRILKRMNTLMSLKLPQPKTVFFVTLIMYALLFTIDLFCNKAHPVTLLSYSLVLTTLYIIWQYDEREKLKHTLANQELYDCLKELLEPKTKPQIHQIVERFDEPNRN